MFLAIKEIKKEKNRFFMIIMVTTLITYLVYFLTGLAFGLAKANTTSIDKWESAGIVLSKAANQNIYASTIDEEVIKQIKTEKSETLNIASTVVAVGKNKDKQYNLVLMGLETPDSNLMTPLVEGKRAKTDEEIVLSESFKNEVDVKLGDTIKIVTTNREFKIVGFSEKSEYNTQPVGYVTSSMAAQTTMIYQLDENAEEDAVTAPTENTPVRYSALVVDKKIDKDLLKKNDLEYLTMDAFIEAIPGYQAQVLTFGLMIISLIIIASVIIGIFMYILTMQKKSIFAILKIQGINNSFISQSVMYQTVIISVLGLALGLLLTLVTFYFMPATVPVQISWQLTGIISGLFILCSLIGSIFSAKSILKIDPLDAL